MSELPSTKAPQSQLERDEHTLRAFFDRNPDYFLTPRGQELLGQINLVAQHDNQGFSLLEHQVRLLREENARLSEELEVLGNVALHNQRTLQGMQEVLVEAISASSLFDFIVGCEQNWGRRFGIDFVRTLSFDRGYPGLHSRSVSLDEAPDAIHEAVLLDEIMCFEGSAELSSYAGDEHAKVRSWCVMPISVDRTELLTLRFALCFGSPRANAFRSEDAGLMFLEFMRRVLQALMSRHVSSIPL